MNKLLKYVVYGLSGLMVLLFASGCISPEPAEVTYQDESEEWINYTENEAERLQYLSVSLMDYLETGTADDQTAKTKISYLIEESDRAINTSAHYNVNSNLSDSQQKFTEMCASYSASAKWLEMTYDHAENGRTDSARATYKKSYGSYDRANKYKAEFIKMLEDYKNK